MFLCCFYADIPTLYSKKKAHMPLMAVTVVTLIHVCCYQYCQINPI